MQMFTALHAAIEFEPIGPSAVLSLVFARRQLCPRLDGWYGHYYQHALYVYGVKEVPGDHRSELSMRQDFIATLSRLRVEN